MISASELRELLQYDLKTGLFHWKTRPTGSKTWNTRFAGRVAGTPSGPGYVLIRVNGVPYFAHRLAWLWTTGDWPTAPHIDHINGLHGDNSWTNLREATCSQNAANSRKSITNTSGAKGVCFDSRKQKWKAEITVNGRSKFLGYFSTVASASLAYTSAANEHFGAFARTQ